MPFEWIPQDKTTQAELHLWPFRSLPKRGFVWIMAMGFALMHLPLLALVGSQILWWLLPFSLGAMGALWYFIERSYKDGEILEELIITHDHIQLERHGPRGQHALWEANPYWVTVERYKTSGPVPDYITLKGNGREVEIGAFLSETERPMLYDELTRAIRRAKTPR